MMKELVNLEEMAGVMALITLRAVTMTMAIVATNIQTAISVMELDVFAIALANLIV